MAVAFKIPFTDKIKLFNDKILFFTFNSLNSKDLTVNPRTMNTKKLTVVLFTFFLGFQSIVAQKVVAKNGNGIEYISDEKDLDDLNAIKAPKKAIAVNTDAKSKPTKKVKTSKKVKKTVKKIKSVKQVEQVLKLRKRLRFRNKRNNDTNKCFKETTTPCGTEQ